MATPLHLAREQATYLADLQAVDNAVAGNPDRKLLVLDTQTGSQARAAIAVGDPDTATHIGVTTPGLNTTVHGSIETMAEEATNLRREALRTATPHPRPQTRHGVHDCVDWV